MSSPIAPRTLSKAVSHALRHQPWVYEIELDDEGWTDLDGLVAALRERGAGWTWVTRQDVADMIAGSDKVRHEIRGDRIRALYGHSVPGKLKRVAGTPPAVLYHGTSPTAAGAILSAGLEPMRRQYVHLSVDRETARQVGLRKSSRPVILRIDAAAALAAGVRFYEGNDKVWLADRVLAAFIGQEE